ncbi:GerMN domain-containing protein [Micromonospora sp. WMMA1363]|uniref:GerMN domain-containing protein n=1 Tax=Micromonospora sp. WMMA1363 TaxID=3053985 RepID=UPI00259CB52C|nr:GerMN domain-containing protein [Micromonospora sp. WMMA1363]MDM4719266.1 GerMN domain-containing protein [Micromonospora sp. WMMA1363]
MTARAAGAVLLVLFLAGCGVPTDDRPRAVEAPPGVFPTPGATTSTVPTGQVDEALCFVRDDHLVKVVRRIDTPPTVDQQLEHLLAGPSPAERDSGLITALPGAVAAAGVRLAGTRAEIDLPATGDETGRSDEVLAFGQIVCTLTAHAEVDAVSFIRDGQPLGVPRADGSLSQVPLVAADYAELTRPG